MAHDIMNTDLEKKERTVVAKHGNMEVSEMFAAIAKAVSDPNLDIDKMERLLAMHERLAIEQRKIAFQAAMARLQEKLPQIAKDAEIPGKNGIIKGRYVRLETLDAVIRPLLAEEGFS